MPTPLQSETPTQTSSPQSEAQEVLVTGDEPTLPDGCSPTEVTHLLRRFLEAYNSGDQEQLASFFPIMFQWYADGRRLSGEDVDEDYLFIAWPGDREDLLSHFAERHEQGDRLQLSRVNVIDRSARDVVIHFRLTREADDVKPGADGAKRYVNGRAVFNCLSQKFFNWLMTVTPLAAPESELAPVCPEPPPGTPENALIACSERLFVSEEAGPPTQVEAREVIVTRDDPTLPGGCGPAETARLIMHFLDAYNSSDQELLADMFALYGDRNRWFSDTRGEEVNFTARRQSSLLNYIAHRRQQDDRLQLVAVEVADSSWHGGVDIVFRLTRTANDLGPDGGERYVRGKGAIMCDLQKFMAWSMGTVPPHFPESDLSHVCPDPPDGAPENAVVACARG
jgi:hypothetical protein